MTKTQFVAIPRARMGTKAGWRRITGYVEPDIYDELEQRRVAMGLPRVDAVRLAVEAWLKSPKSKAA